MKNLFTYALVFVALLSQLLFARPEKGCLKPRLVVLTDISTWETDDHESLTRLLVHADLYEIEAIVFSTGWSWGAIEDSTVGLDLIHGVIDAYEKDLPNLMKRSNQVDFLPDEGRQEIGYWPSPDYLRKHTVMGSAARGRKFIGPDNNSTGSRLIIDLADQDDERPLWVTVWGGGNTLAQAIWQVQQSRSKAELKDFLHQLRVYAITDQDRHYDGSEGYEISSHQWLRREFQGDLFFIWDECAWKYQNGTGRRNWSQYAEHIQNHGHLGSQYPKYIYGVEGDTPAFLHLLPNGLNDPGDPSQCGWGGYAEWGLCADSLTFAYTNHSDPAKSICNKYEDHFYPATFNNFAARMDWAKQGKGNRNPVVVIDDDNGLAPIIKKPRPGATVTLDASKTFDPDGDALAFKWWVQPEAGSYSNSITISNSDSSIAILQVPADSDGKTFHVICEVIDNGTHNLSAYRRIIFEPALSASNTSQKPRVIISTDIGGSDPDDFQSMIHYLMYADLFDTEGLISSPWGKGRKEHILQVIDKYEQDYPNLRSYSDQYPTPDYLRSITKQGAEERAPGKGFREATEGSDWIIQCAHKKDDRPLYILVWGLLEDVAQALHDDPSIQDKIRVYYIGGPNKKWGADAYNYIEENFPDLWMIENNSTYRGWFVGGIQEGEWSNDNFFEYHLKSHGALGDYFKNFYDGKIKMGDTPSVGYLLHGNSDDPTQPGWGGRFRPVSVRPKTVFNGHPTLEDKTEVFSIVEIVLNGPDIGPATDTPQFSIIISNQEFEGYYYGDGVYKVRWSPKAVGQWSYVTKSKIPELDGKTGRFTSVDENTLPPHPQAKQHSHWWTDILDPEYKEDGHCGAKTISVYRKQYLQDFANRADRCIAPKGGKK